MASERQRLVELALESLQDKKRQIDQEFETLTREMRGRRGKVTAAAPAPAKKPAVAKTKKRSRYTREERLRRSQRMKAYWENRRKQQKAQN